MCVHEYLLQLQIQEIAVLHTSKENSFPSMCIKFSNENTKKY